MNFEYEAGPVEELTVVKGPDAVEVARTIFGVEPEPSRLHSLGWLAGAPRAAVCWLPPARLEIRLPAAGGWASRLRTRLDEIRNGERSPFLRRLDALIERLEAWNYADSDPGGGMEEMARDVAALDEQAPNAAARREIITARDALDDGLPAEVVSAALYRARRAATGRVL